MADKYKITIGGQSLEFTLEKITDSDTGDDDPVVTASGNRNANGDVLLPYRPHENLTLDMAPSEAITRLFNIIVYNTGTFQKGLKMHMLNTLSCPDEPIKPRRVVDNVIQKTYLDAIFDPGNYLYCVTGWIESKNLTTTQQLQDNTCVELYVSGDKTNVKAPKFYLQPASGGYYYVNGVKYTGE